MCRVSASNRPKTLNSLSTSDEDEYDFYQLLFLVSIQLRKTSSESSHHYAFLTPLLSVLHFTWWLWLDDKEDHHHRHDHDRHLHLSAKGDATTKLWSESKWMFHRLFPSFMFLLLDTPVRGGVQYVAMRNWI